MFKLLDRKANLVDLQDATKNKIDQTKLEDFASKKELQDVAYKMHHTSDQLNLKMELRDFEDLELNRMKMIEDL